MAHRKQESTESLATTLDAHVSTKRPVAVTGPGPKAKPGRVPGGNARPRRVTGPRDVGAVTIKPGAAALFEVPDEVRRVVFALGSNVVADVLGVSRSQPGRWSSGREQISAVNRARLADLDHVLNRLLQVLWPEEAGAWLTAPNPHAGGRPIDVLALRGAGPVIEAIDALAQGAYA